MTRASPPGTSALLSYQETRLLFFVIHYEQFDKPLHADIASQTTFAPLHADRFSGTWRSDAGEFELRVTIEEDGTDALVYIEHIEENNDDDKDDDGRQGLHFTQYIDTIFGKFAFDGTWWQGCLFSCNGDKRLGSFRIRLLSEHVANFQISFAPLTSLQWEKDVTAVKFPTP